MQLYRCQDLIAYEPRVCLHSVHVGGKGAESCVAKSTPQQAAQDDGDTGTTEQYSASLDHSRFEFGALTVQDTASVLVVTLTLSTKTPSAPLETVYVMDLQVHHSGSMTPDGTSCCQY